MTPKEKAHELINRFSSVQTRLTYIDAKGAKQCAMIAVNEIIKTDMLIDEEIYVDTVSYLGFWEAVRDEINGL